MKNSFDGCLLIIVIPVIQLIYKWSREMMCFVFLHLRLSHLIIMIYPIIIQCEAPKIAKLVYNSNNYGLW